MTEILWTGEALRVRALLDRDAIRPGMSSPLHAVFKLEALARAVDGARPPLSVVFALDVSGSMKGPPLEQVILSVEKLAELLDGRDRVGVCVFANNAAEALPLSPLDDATRSLLRRRVRALKAGGGTHLESGLRKSMTMLGERQGDERQVVLLLTDGAPNHGAVAPEALATIAAAERPRVAVTTLGYGAHHHADVLTAIAEGGGGQYWFIPDPEEAGQELARVLGAQGDVAVEGVELCLEPGEGVEVGELAGAGKPRFTREGIVASARDLFESQAHHVVVPLRVTAPSEAGPLPLLAATVRHHRAGQRGLLLGRVELEVAVRERAATVNEEAAAVVVLAEAEAVRRAARHEADQGRFDAAAAMLRQLMTKLEATPGYQAGTESPLSEAYEQLYDEVVAYETKPSVEQYQQFRSMQLGVDIAQGGKHVAEVAARSRSSSAMVSQSAGAPLAGKVYVQGRGGEEQEVPLRGEMTIGRVQGSDIVLPYGSISKRHTRLVVREGRAIVVCLKSTNGTYVNGKRLHAPHVLQPDDVINVGDFTLRVVLDEP